MWSYHILRASCEGSDGEMESNRNGMEVNFSDMEKWNMGKEETIETQWKMKYSRKTWLMGGSFARTSLTLDSLGKPRTDLREFCSAPNFQEIPCAMSTVTIYTAKHLKFQNIEYEHVDQCVGWAPSMYVVLVLIPRSV